jgi:hypothetical protein
VVQGRPSHWGNVRPTDVHVERSGSHRTGP